MMSVTRAGFGANISGMTDPLVRPFRGGREQRLAAGLPTSHSAMNLFPPLKLQDGHPCPSEYYQEEEETGHKRQPLCSAHLHIVLQGPWHSVRVSLQ